MKKLLVILIGLLTSAVYSSGIRWSQDYYQISCPSPKTIIVNDKLWQGEFIISKSNTYIGTVTAYTNNESNLIPQKLIRATSYSYPDPSLDFTCYYSTNKLNVIAKISSDSYLPTSFSNCNFSNVTDFYMQCGVSGDNDCTLSCQNQ
jgi:hypothetical protein